MNPNWITLGRKIAAAGFPAIGAGLGGPAGARLGERLARALDVEPEPDAIARAMALDPDLAIALRQIEAEEAAATRADELRAQEIAAADAQAARIAHKGERWPYVIDFMVMVMVAGLVLALVLVKIPAENESTFNIVLGAVLGSFTTVIAFWRGSSRGSGRKQEILDAVMQERI